MILKQILTVCFKYIDILMKVFFITITIIYKKHKLRYSGYIHTIYTHLHII